MAGKVVFALLHFSYVQVVAKSTAELI